MFIECVYLWEVSGPRKRVGYGNTGLRLHLLLLNSLLDISHPFCQSSILLEEYNFVRQLYYLICQWAHLQLLESESNINRNS
jgi:hypothetical protein